MRGLKHGIDIEFCEAFSGFKSKIILFVTSLEWGMGLGNMGEQRCEEEGGTSPRQAKVKIRNRSMPFFNFICFG